MAFQFRRGSNAERTTITPLAGEPLWTTDTNILYVGDGTTAGGIAVSGSGGGGTSTVTNQLLFTTSSVRFEQIGLGVDGANAALVISTSSRSATTFYANINPSVNSVVYFPDGFEMGGSILLTDVNQRIITPELSANSLTGVTDFTDNLNGIVASISTNTFNITTATISDRAIIGADSQYIYASSFNELGVSNNFNVPNVLVMGSGSGNGYISSKGNYNLELNTSDNDGPGPKIVIAPGHGAFITFTDDASRTIATFNTSSIALSQNTAITGTLSATGNATLSGTQNVISTSTTAATDVRLFNGSATTALQPKVVFQRLRGSNTAPNSSTMMGTVAFDGFQSAARGYAADYADNKLFPGMTSRVVSFGTNAAQNRTQIMARAGYTAGAPFPYSVIEGNATDTNVITILDLRTDVSQMNTDQLVYQDTDSGYSQFNPSMAATSATYGLSQAGLGTGPGHKIRLGLDAAKNSAALVRNSEKKLHIQARTDDINYDNVIYAMTTSSGSQIDFAWNGTTTAGGQAAAQLVKGAKIELNSLRYTSLTRGAFLNTTAYTALWNTSTRAGDVLGSLSFQGGLGYTTLSDVDGRVDGAVMRAYAINNWDGEQNSTNTSVTKTANRTGICIDISTSTTLGGASQNFAGIRQQYKRVWDLNDTTATYKVEVAAEKPVQIKDLFVLTAKTADPGGTTATGTVLMTDGTQWDPAGYSTTTNYVAFYNGGSWVALG